MKNNKKIFFVLTLLTLLIAVSTVNAVDNTTVADDTTAINDASSDTSSTQEEVQSTITENVVKTNNNVIENTKNNVIKQEKNIKKDLIRLNGEENEEELNVLTKSVNINGTYIIENYNFPDYGTGLGFDGDVTLINCTLINPFTANYGILEFKNSTVTANLLLNSGTIYVNDYTDLTSTMIMGAGEVIHTERITYDGIVENENISTSFTNNNEVTFVNCNITAQITNNANMTFINCSISNLNIVNTAVSMNERKNITLIENNGNMTFINLTMENNTFNSTQKNMPPIPDAIVNNANMFIANSTFSNNTKGYCYYIDGDGYHVFGTGTCITCGDNGFLIIDNCNFTDNYAGSSGGAFVGQGNINNSRFTNNVAGLYAGAIIGTFNIGNCNFTHNGVECLGVNSGGGSAVYGGGAIVGSGNITGCVFTDNYAMSGSLTGSDGQTLMGVKIGGGAIQNVGKTLIDNCSFINNSASAGAAIINGHISDISAGELVINNSLFDSNHADLDTDSAIIYSGYSTTNITGNQFVNNYNTSYIINNQLGKCRIFYDIVYLNTSHSLNWYECITQNTFANNTASSGTLNSLEPEWISKEANIYTNTTINDTLTLNIPNKIYTDQPTTITGTYAINNPDDYDADILEQTQFNVYIDGDFYQTFDDLEFTITPTSSNMILTVQPTISQTRKSASIKPVTINFTLADVTATIGETAQLVAQITVTEDGEDMEVNTGRVYFKVNGKVLRDADTGKILYADVTDNTATIGYIVPKTWDDETEIVAVFVGNDEVPEVTSNTVNPTITVSESEEPEFRVDDVTGTAGEEVTITVTTKNLDTGKLVLKVNGKTVKTTDGKLYAKTTGDTTTFTYTVPKTLKSGEYTIKAVYTSGVTKLEAEASLTVA